MLFDITFVTLPTFSFTYVLVAKHSIPYSLKGKFLAEAALV